MCFTIYEGSEEGVLGSMAAAAEMHAWLLQEGMAREHSSATTYQGLLLAQTCKHPGRSGWTEPGQTPTTTETVWPWASHSVSQSLGRPSVNEG